MQGEQRESACSRVARLSYFEFELSAAFHSSVLSIQPFSIQNSVLSRSYFQSEMLPAFVSSRQKRVSCSSIITLFDFNTNAPLLMFRIARQPDSYCQSLMSGHCIDLGLSIPPRLPFLLPSCIPYFLLFLLLALCEALRLLEKKQSKYSFRQRSKELLLISIVKNKYKISKKPIIARIIHKCFSVHGNNMELTRRSNLDYNNTLSRTRNLVSSKPFFFIYKTPTSKH